MHSILKIITTGITLTVALAVPVVWAQAANAKAPVDCKTPTTQADMNECAHEDFLTANAGYAETSRTIFSRLPGKQRDLFQRSQKAWLAYRTATCDFEGSGLAGGSAQGMVNWQCVARMTRARVLELRAIGNCAEGDVACVRFTK